MVSEESTGSSLPEQVQRLERLWRAEHPARASGALNALAGFHYQFLIALLETVRAWLAAPPVYREPRVWSEQLSDVLHLQWDEIVSVTQVKKSLSGTQLRAALDELWLIHCLALRKLPQVSARLRFRIVASRALTSFVTKNLDKWSPRGASEVAAGEVAAFRKRVTVSVEADPEDTLLALLVNELRASDPLGLVDRWMGELQAAAGKGEYATVAKRIWSDLSSLSKQDLQSQRPAGIYLWTAEDRPPEEISPGGFLAGQQPQVHHLRKGFFAERREVYDLLREHAEEWLESSPGVDERGLKVPIFWVGGRSGAGKSIALLWLLAGLHDRGWDPIIWLSDKVELLPDTLKWVRQRLQRPGRRALVAVDDPFTPTEQGSGMRIWEALDVLQDAREGDRVEELPLILCCGPTEQAELLASERVRDIVLERHDLVETAEEMGKLREWYFRRTGQAPPQLGGEKILPVQLFFEWRVERSLPEFAANFQRRLRAADATGSLLGFITELLALNRLYVGYPRAAMERALTPGQRDKLQRLRDEEHIEDDAVGRPGMWLAHPHLANAIYESWYPQSDAHREERKGHLLAAVEACLRHGDHPQKRLAPLWALVRILGGEVSGGPELAERVEAGAVRELLPELYARVASAEEIRTSDLPLWIEVRARCPEARLEPNPVALAVRSIRVDRIGESDLSLTCKKLLHHLEQLPSDHRAEVRHAVIGLLTATADGSWQDWSSLLFDALERLQETRLWSLVEARCSRSPKSVATAYFLGRALSAAGPDSPLGELAEKLLRGAPGEEAWADLAMQILRQRSDDSVPKAVDIWVGQHRRRRSVRYLLVQLLERGYPPALKWAHQWAEFRHRERLAKPVLEALCRHAPPSPELRDWCCCWFAVGRVSSRTLLDALPRLFPGDSEVKAAFGQWLEHTPIEHRFWPLVLHSAQRLSPENPDLHRLAWQWLRQASMREGYWSYIWQTLWSRTPGDGDLIGLGRHWLGGTPPFHVTWPFVWRALWNVSPRDSELEAMAWQAVRESRLRPGAWYTIWKNLWKTCDPAKGLDQGRRWLREAPAENPFWLRVWMHLREMAPDDPELLRIARSWVEEAAFQNHLWGVVWSRLYAEVPDPGLARLGLQWLRKTPPEHKSWRHVWKPLWEADPESPELCRLGPQWLEAAAFESSSWITVWKALWEGTPGEPGLAGLARQWLSEVSPQHGGWELVWRRLWSLEPGDAGLESLAWRTLAETRLADETWQIIWQHLWKSCQHRSGVEHARKWLRGAPLEHNFWQMVFAVCWKAAPGDPELEHLAREWLARGRASHPAWQYVWQPLWELHPREAQLRAIARDWLARAQPHHSWAFVWRVLWSQEPGDADLADLAWEALRSPDLEQRLWKIIWNALARAPWPEPWLEHACRWLEETPPEHRFWPLAWKELWSTACGNPELVRLGRKWLIEAPPGHLGWGLIWRELRVTIPEDPELDRLVRNRLRTLPSEHAGWHFAWKELWAIAPGDAELEGLCREWLRHVSAAHRSWQYAWLDLWQSSLGDVELEALARRWLQEAPLHPSWSFAWQPLWTQGRRDGELEELGRGWLLRTIHDLSPWAYVWGPLWQETPGHPELATLARAWLQHAPVTRDSWGDVWKRLWQMWPLDPELLLLAWSWLHRASSQNRSWEEVWLLLHESFPGDPELSEIAQRNLRHLDPAALPRLREVSASWSEIV